MDDTNQKETVHGYEIQRAVTFENDRGDAVAAELRAGKRQENTHERLKRRFKVLSLDAEDGVEAEASAHSTDNPEALLEMMERHCGLCRALNSLPEIQGRRVEAHFAIGRSIQEIAADEKVSESSVKESIDRGIKAMRKNYFNNFSKLPCEMPDFCPDI